MSTKNILKNIKKKLRSFGRKSRVFDPEKDWKNIFIASVFLLCISLIVNGVIFWQVKEGEIFNVGGIDVNISPQVDEEVLEKTLDQYRAQQQRSDKILEDGVSTFDPSV